jgi:hypothetical protein
MAIALLTRSERNSMSWEVARADAIAVARELSGNRVPDDFVGCYISVVDERGVVVFKVPL